MHIDRGRRVFYQLCGALTRQCNVSLQLTLAGPRAALPIMNVSFLPVSGRRMWRTSAGHRRRPRRRNEPASAQEENDGEILLPSCLKIRFYTSDWQRPQTLAWRQSVCAWSDKDVRNLPISLCGAARLLGSEVSVVNSLLTSMIIYILISLYKNSVVPSARWAMIISQLKR